MRRQKFFGYWIVVYSFIVMFFVFTIVRSLHSLFLVPVTESLGMERSAFSFLFTVFGVAVAVALPVVTKLLRRFSVRKILVWSIAMVSAGFASYAFAKEPWHFYVIAAVVGAGTAGCTNMVLSLLINNWFVDKKGLAMGITFTGSGFGAVCITPVLTQSIHILGWQASYILCGLVMACVCIPLTFLLAYPHPRDKGQKPYQEKGHAIVTDEEITATGFLYENIKGKPYFWLFLVIIFATTITLGGVHMHIPAYLSDIGHTPSFVATVIMLQSLCLIPGKILLGEIFDHFGSKVGTAFLGITLSGAYLCLVFAKNPLFAIAFAVLYGCGATVTTVGIPYLTGSIFGQKDYTKILSVTNIFYMIGISTGPFLSGVAYDLLGQYRWTWITYLVVYASSMAGLFLLEKYLKKKQM